MQLKPGFSDDEVIELTGPIAERCHEPTTV